MVLEFDGVDERLILGTYARMYKGINKIIVMSNTHAC
jgi:hypothetical protein